MGRLQSLKDRLRDIERELEALRIFRLTPYLKKFQRNLAGEYSYVKAEIAKLESNEQNKEKEILERIQTANKNRSEKMKRIWRYLKAIQENYPTELSLRELRSALKRHRQGLETDIPDVAWRNPSP